MKSQLRFVTQFVQNTVSTNVSLAESREGGRCPLQLTIWFWLCALHDCHLPSLHLDFGIKFINLLSEAAPELIPLGFQGGRQQAILDRKHLRM